MPIHPSTGSNCDLLVIGGGIMGTFYAYHALQRGLRVILLERNAQPENATVRNFGQIVPSGLDDTWQPMGRESLAIYQSLQSQTDLTVRQNGSYYIASDDEECTLLEELHARNQSTGYQSELWTAKQCLSQFPSLQPSYCKAALYFPEELSVDPRQMIHRLQSHLAKRDGFKASFNTLVQRLESNSGHVEAITSNGHRFTASRAILCGGADFQTLFPEVFARSGMQLCKLQMLRLAPQPQCVLPGNILTGWSIRRYESFSQCPSWNEIQSRDEAASDRKRWGLHILFKQESDGSIIVGDSHEYTSADQPNALSFEIRSDINAAILREAQRIMQLQNWQMESTWYGIYSQTKDPAGIFCHSVAPNIHITTGIGGKGMTSSAGFTRRHLSEIYDD
ncbi:TIGR03364 family FAD-dependent oxidoreductase [Rhodopirellula halodulae]|uniref:TIGR03364 family FAD-dependent oxidoreductase n=1 Tax=Rhodopirellula halodulae TaxID=2894198 RepID=UPI001E499002|nr:TIGR03364 family FAD-dependent oxidoreductase [Rhodopirellula sp. JC737]MCC9658082.1 TIGR03364 family FAD-dependent oxidoreductase [Rhodopirellula sp. JC737]